MDTGEDRDRETTGDRRGRRRWRKTGERETGERETGEGVGRGREMNSKKVGGGKGEGKEKREKR